MLVDKGHYIQYTCNSCGTTRSVVKTIVSFSEPDNNYYQPLPDKWTKTQPNHTYKFCSHNCEDCSNIKDILE